MPLLHRSLSPFILGAALALAAAPALAEKPPHAGGGKHGQAEDKPRGGGKPHKGGGDDRDRDGGARHAPSGGDRSDISVNLQIGGYFTDAQRRTVVEYYEPRFRAGHCPPGLAKQHNG